MIGLCHKCFGSGKAIVLWEGQPVCSDCDCIGADID